MVKLLVIVVFLATATLAYADIRQSEGSRALAQKGDEGPLSGFVKNVSLQEKLAVVTKTGKNERRYPLGDYGFFWIEIPSSWKDELRQPSKQLPPTIVLGPAGGNAFQILMTPIGGTKKEGLKDDTIRGIVQRSLDQVKPQAVERTLDLVEFEGTSGKGYYFFATDKAPKPGEHKYLTQGVIVVGELMVTFTILTNNNLDGTSKEALSVLRNARHLK
jgi:hypothetical protein